MQKRALLLLVVILLFTFFKVFSQENIDLQSVIVDSLLTEKANAIVRSEDVVIEINSVNSMTVKTKRVVTVLNKLGNGYADSYEGYNPGIKIKKLQATVYDKLGKEIKKYKKNDFDDRSAIGSGTMYSDNRIKYFNHTPQEYPYTLVFESEVEKISTAFIQGWQPILSYYLSVQKSRYQIINPARIPLRYKEINFDEYSIGIDNKEYEVLYTITNVAAKQPEVYSPAFNDLIPKVLVAINNFSLEGVEGTAVDWNTFGKWQYDNLVQGRDELSDATKEKMRQLISGVKTKKEKAKLIYEYVQHKTRYIGVQLGIGGWMPFKAGDVDRLGYGDCKALTNYTKALLASQGILSYYTVVYADDKRDIDEEFASMQGNHVILNIPDNEEDLWLECTSQTMPFNFIGDFTDDRNVLVIKPEGGEIKRTKKYESEENTIAITATVDLRADKSISAKIQRVSNGLKYDKHYGIQFSTLKDKDLYYKEEWSYINGLKIKSIQLDDDKDTASFTENIELSGTSYVKKAGSRLLIAPNIFDRDQNNLPKYKNRSTPLVISRGYTHSNEYTINLPDGYIASSLPDKKVIETKFGKYSYEVNRKEGNLIFKRYLKIIDGIFPKEEYEEYRKFRSEIKNIDKSKMVLTVK